MGRHRKKRPPSAAGPGKTNRKDFLVKDNRKKYPYEKLTALDKNPRDPNARKFSKKKVAVVFSYNGTKYDGLQINPGANSVEKALEQAMFEAGAITADNHEQFQKVQWTRAARTDKGVHAAANVVSLKVVMVDNLVQEINSKLPEDIHIASIFPVQRSFGAKRSCTSRHYSYILPSFAFSPPTKPSSPHTTPLTAASVSPAAASASEATPVSVSATVGKAPVSASLDSVSPSLPWPLCFTMDAELRARVDAILSLYVGTLNFHNFTTRRTANDPSCTRYILSFKVDDIFVHKGVEFVRLVVHGASFMLHQIRKMIGLAIGVFHGVVGEHMLAKAIVFTKTRYRIPTAPALGLLLDRCVFNGYDLRVKSPNNDPTAVRPTFASTYTAIEADVDKFCKAKVYPTICDAELQEESMMKWLQHLRKVDRGWGEEIRERLFKPWSRLSGVIVSALTMRDAQGEVDTSWITAHANFLARSGVVAVLVNGIVGEGIALSTSQRNRAMQAWKGACSKSKPALQLLVDISHESLSSSCALAKHAAAMGVYALVLRAPSFFAPASPQDLTRYLTKVASAVPETPLYFHDCPGHSGAKRPVWKMLRHTATSVPSLVGVLFESTDLPSLRRGLSLDKGDNEMIYAGSAFLAGQAMGVRVVLGGALSFVRPTPFVEGAAAANEGNWAAARKAQDIVLAWDVEALNEDDVVPDLIFSKSLLSASIASQGTKEGRSE